MSGVANYVRQWILSKLLPINLHHLNPEDEMGSLYDDGKSSTFSAWSSDFWEGKFMIERVSLIQDDCTALGLPLWVNRVEIDELVISISTFQLLEVPPVVTLKGVRVDLGRQLRSQEPKTSARPEGYSIWENLRRFLILNTAIYVDRLDVRNVDFTSISFRDVKSTVHSTLAKEGRRHWSKHVKTKPIGCGWTYERTTQCDLADIQIRGAPMATLHALSFTHSFPQVREAWSGQKCISDA
ncbi:hypothetical protein AAMO2058_001334600 [Amorphochlora amoebiformis]